MIANIAVSLLAVAGFGLALWKIGVVPVARTAVATALSGLSAMTDRDLDDDAKEMAVRRAALSLLGAAVSIAVRFAVVLAAAAVPILFADLLGVAEADAVTALMLRLDYILLVSAAAILAGEMLRRWYTRREAGPDATTSAAAKVGSAYSDVDRFLHSVAFSSPAVLRAASRIEDGLLGTPRIEAGPPIFVTSLARGGTTALLNALSRLPGVASHTYRDMPFLTAPVLWNRLAGGVRRRVDRRDRVHGDGLTIDLDSPEAFEEVIWKMFWPEKYGTDRIDLWTAVDRKPGADRFLARHMNKILRARLGQSPPGPARYCSKNNANIGRLAYLPGAFSGCRVVVPLRRPESHAASLLRQHRNFLGLQDEDDFVRRYMRDIGHFEFGLIHRPLAFPGFEPTHFDPTAPDHWLDYWIHAFREVEARISAGQDLILVTQDSLRQRPQDTIQALAERLGLHPSGQRFDADFLNTPDRGEDDAFDLRLLREARELYDVLTVNAL